MDGLPEQSSPMRSKLRQLRAVAAPCRSTRTGLALSRQAGQAGPSRWHGRRGGPSAARVAQALVLAHVVGLELLRNLARLLHLACG